MRRNQESCPVWLSLISSLSLAICARRKSRNDHLSDPRVMCCSAVGGQQSAESPPQSLIALLVPLIGWVAKCPTPRWDRCPKISQAIHSVLRNLVEGVERRGIEIAISVQSEREELRK